MHWDVDGRSQKVMKEIAAAVKNADKLILATDPDREGEAISWHILRILEEKKALKKGVPVERVTFNAVTKQSVLDAFKAPREIDAPLVEAYLARRALDYLVGFTLSPGAVAQAAGRPLGGPRAVGGAAAGVRPRGRDRGLQDRRILDHRGHARDRARARSSPPASRHRRQEARQARPQGRGLRHRHQGRHREGRLPRRPRREEGGEAQPVRAVRHLDAADGCLAQARLLGQADHAARPAPLRGRRHRRRDGRPHHLHANRRRHDHPRGHQRHPRPDRARVFAALRAALHPRVQDQGQERAGGARGDPPDRRHAPPAGRRRAISSATRPASTS